MVYLHQENHDDLTYFHSERMCKPCGRRYGISY
jgi:hypothetical protein